MQAFEGSGVRAGKLTSFAIISGAFGLLCSGPVLLQSGPLGWAAETFCICSAAAALGQIPLRNRSARKLMAELQEHEAALDPEGAKAPAATIDAAARAIVNSAESIVARSAARANDLQLRVQELEISLQMAQAALKSSEFILNHTTGSVQLPTVETETTVIDSLEITDMQTAFVSKVSHDLRTPLASIKAYIEMLIDGEATDAATQKQFYEIIQSEANRLGKLIDRTLMAAA